MATRATYDLLGLAGDVGGLNEVLSGVGFVLVAWFNYRNGMSVLASDLFKTQDGEYKEVSIRQHKQSPDKKKINSSNEISKNMATSYTYR